MKTQTIGASHFFRACPIAPGAPPRILPGLVREKSGTKYGWAFVPGAFPPKAVDELRKHDWYKDRLDEARDAYQANRKNGVDGDSPAHPFPGDGAYSWDTPESEVSSAIRYTEGPQDKAWMEARDRNYVFRLEREGRLDKTEPNLRTEVPKLYAEVMAKQQARLAEEKMAQEAEARLAEQARAQAAAAKKLETDLIRARMQLTKDGAYWKNAALKSFQQILLEYPNHFEALCHVANISLEQKGAAAIGEVKYFVLERFKQIPEGQSALYVSMVNKLTAQLFATGLIEHAHLALLIYETTLSRLPQEPSLLQGQQQAVNKLAARSKALQDKATVCTAEGEPQYSPRTRHHFFKGAIELDERLKPYSGQKDIENLIFLQGEIQDLESEIQQLVPETADATAARQTHLAQELHAWEVTQQAHIAEPAAETEQKPASERSFSSSERVRQWHEANAAAVDVDARPFTDDLDNNDIMSEMTAEFDSVDPSKIAEALIKCIRREGSFGILIEEDEYIEVRCRAGKVEPVLAQALKVTLSKLFERQINCSEGPDGQIIRLPWERLSYKQVRKFETLFAREKQALLSVSIHDAVEDNGFDIQGLARRVGQAP